MDVQISSNLSFTLLPVIIVLHSQVSLYCFENCLSGSCVSDSLFGFGFRLRNGNCAKMGVVYS